MLITYAQKGFKLGIMGGPQLTGIKGLAVEKLRTFNWNAGMNVGYSFTERRSISLGLCYSSQGQRYKLNYLNAIFISTGLIAENETYYQHLNFLKIPLLFNYKSNTTQRIAYYGSIGPELTYLSKATLNFVHANLSKDVSFAYKKTNFGIAAAYGISIKLNENVQVLTGMHFSHDLLKASTFFTEKLYNFTEGVEFGLVYQFNKKKA